MLPYASEASGRSSTAFTTLKMAVFAPMRWLSALIGRVLPTRSNSRSCSTLDKVEIAAIKYPEGFVSPAWSPDGKVIASAAGQDAGGKRMYVAAVSVGDWKVPTLHMMCTESLPA